LVENHTTYQRLVLEMEYSVVQSMMLFWRTTNRIHQLKHHYQIKNL
jgi:hypothetical protein